MTTRRRLRVAFAAVLLLAVAVVGYGAVTAERSGTAADVPSVEPRENATVVTESAHYGTIMAWHSNGSRLYYDDAYTKYFDVDPVDDGRYTVEYAATNTITDEGPRCSSPPCAVNVIERANLSTGETEVIYERVDPSQRASEWHDHERIDDSHVVIADMVHDQVFVVDTETELVEWRWDAQSDFPVEGGGPYPEDWAHLNDVDVLPDGRLMVSLRNQDSVVFLDRETGLIEDWTLGTDGDHETLYEQHNPDYIPASEGGPAVLVADSENGRIVEYQREDGSWTQSWEWSDGRMQWPRDADRLPNGNTLVTDTHGGRVIEIAPNGSVVWSAPVDHPYDVERFGTGSEGGPSAARIDATSRIATGDATNENDPVTATFLHGVTDLLESIFPNWIVNGVFYTAPVWMGHTHVYASALAIFVAVTWGVFEFRWRYPTVSIRSPLYVDEPTADEDDHVDAPTEDQSDRDGAS